ncbi:ribosomal protein S18-alanine N-acetyltransferase [Lederbergia citrea]|uniref:[Ribosomal protein bS18]-alanine N-acetyltransferase n=1 Tax=Lederbergia citrea TaxID=2833581 RepID=A0A942Z6S6_9BACI|nr:ribosomal protein S18-alanine N-acetyltransferase [Lederbergia citrea]MBS4179608.1 ribosomal protein S18-alanine N-acetyltransferase [Lederbergia citrea]MBS4206275.1 ribosomal protein S18-alanine N-acetyltransferase [Lederbergia citrea]MBS4224790.1 ribosomal protein S18-alanine N-acetyltransferase [Lederbergia citrea]
MINYSPKTWDITFRFATEDDIERLVDIEQKSFTVPWPAEAFYNDITNNRFAVYVMLECDGEVAGYCGVWLVMDEAHITNIAILPEYRGRKLGESLLRKMMSLAKEGGANTMTLEVRVSNTPARSLYQKLGFREGGIRKNYYSDNQEDAIVMWVKL